MRWAELRMCRFWAGGISSFPVSRAREYRLLRRLTLTPRNKFKVSTMLNNHMQFRISYQTKVYIKLKISLFYFK